jgi:hypothetical protein
LPSGLFVNDQQKTKIEINMKGLFYKIEVSNNEMVGKVKRRSENPGKTIKSQYTETFIHQNKPCIAIDVIACKEGGII